MKKEEALELLETAPRDDQFSRVNTNLTRKQSTEIVEGAIETYRDGQTLTSLTEKRVWQVTKDRKRPSY